MKTKSVEFMPFYLSLFSLLTSLMWTIYGILGRDPYLTVSIESIKLYFHTKSLGQTELLPTNQLAVLF
jgi:solute carrier family 50 protein (sugar transporter)